MTVFHLVVGVMVLAIVMHSNVLGLMEMRVVVQVVVVVKMVIFVVTLVHVLNVVAIVMSIEVTNGVSV
ncbi:MAG: hypothetical protein GY849_20365 [Deltaproteobacteria bacterium]|nr:hypothetical protein [Deltaproteobacteria bacterium]